MSNSAIFVMDISAIVNEFGGNNMTAEVTYYAGNAAPSGWIPADGRALSRAAYAALFAVIGTTYGAGDGATTFNLPDLRGEFLRGWDNGRGIDTGRVLGSSQRGSLTAFDDVNSDVVMGLYATGATSADKAKNLGMDLTVAAAYPAASTNYVAKGGTGAGMEAQTGVSRPCNVAMLAIIKY